MQKLVPHLWFDKEALEAAKLYISLFENSKLNSTRILPDTPSENSMIVDFDLAGTKLMLLVQDQFSD